MMVFDTITFASQFPLAILVALSVVAAALFLVGLARRRRGAWVRGLPYLILIAALLDPRLIKEQRLPQDDIAVVVVDDSPSQNVGGRHAQTEAALASLLERLKGIEHLAVRVEKLGTADLADEGTRLFAAARRATSAVPRRRLGGVIMITDGQVHDVPADSSQNPGTPLHVLLTGRPNEGDRRLVVARSSGFGIVGKPIPVTVTVVDSGGDDTPRNAALTVRQDGGTTRTLTVPVGHPYTLQIDVAHGGPNVVEFEVEPGPAELSLINNHVAITIGGVRDRLKVLLISGRPHPGERTWRNLLKADANVDLVHFTILRSANSGDFTPLNELALIAFPMRELFEEKLSDFDLVIFDRYGQHNLVPTAYIENVVRYVQKGGAVLVSAGEEFTDITSLSETPLSRILPAAPTGRILDKLFLPTLTSQGFRHPVTGSLEGAGLPSSTPSWGRWLRHIEANPISGDVLMAGVGGRPLLVLDHVGDGRVALLLSDGIWLWERGYEGGGPQAELLRRLAHWLMKEPELEENALTAEVQGQVLTVTRRSMEAAPATVILTAPSGAEQKVPLTEMGGGRASAAVPLIGPLAEPGVFRVSDGRRFAVAAAGALNSLELADLAATDRLLKPVAQASGGGVFWLENKGVPDLRRVRPGATAFGETWLGLRANEDYVVTGVEQVPLLPPWLVLPLLLGSLILAWYREGR